MRSTTLHWAVALLLPLLVVHPAVGDPVMFCQLSGGGAIPGSEVLLDVFLQDAIDVGGYRTAISITRASGTGALSANCPGGVTIDESRPEYIFHDQGATVLLIECPTLRASSSLPSGGVNVGPTPAYLSTYTLAVSNDAAPGSAFEIAILLTPESALTDSNSAPIPFLVGTPCTLTVEPFPTLSLATDACSQCVQAPQMVTVTLEVSSLTEAVNGVQALFHYDATALVLDSLIPGDGAGSPWDTAEWVFFNDNVGDVTAAWILNGGGSADDAAVATASFSILGPGATDLAFRPADPPYFTKITTVAENATILPVLIDSGDIILDQTSKGDLNGDGLRDGGDIQGFVDVLLDPASASPAAFCAADMNADGIVELGSDGPLFINCLLTGDCVCP